MRKLFVLFAIYLAWAMALPPIGAQNPSMGGTSKLGGTATMGGNAGGGATIAVVATCNLVGAVNAAPQTAACNTTGASLLVAIQVYSTITDTHTLTDGNTSGFTGSLNTWTCYKAENNSSYAGVQICYTTASPTTSSTHYFRQTCTGTCTGYRQNVAAMAFSGTNSNPFDLSVHAFGSGSSLLVNPGSITPSQTNELLVTAFTGNGLGGTGIAIDSGFTITTTNTANWDSGVAYLIPAGTSAVNPQWSETTGSNGLNAAMISFTHP